MTTFTFTIPHNGAAQFHDVLSCLAKFDENISLEANTKELRISSLNLSKTAYASFLFDAATFFDRYNFIPDENASRRIWACRIQNRALLSIFKKRRVDNRGKEASIERCEFELQAREDEAECRLMIKLFCRSSVIKTYRLTYESTDVLHAIFDSQGSPNTWTISSRTLRDVVEYFGPKTEHVDWSLQAGKVIFTSYTDKVQIGREIIRQPTHTSVTLNERDFDECNIEQGLHISVPVKDFRAIVAHADTMKANAKTSYSRGHRPAQITYSTGGLKAEFTLMTKGTSSSAINNSRTATPAHGLSIRPTSQPAASLRAQSMSESTQNDISATLRRGATSNKTARFADQDQQAVPKPSATTEASAPPASVNPDSLFFPAPEDEDQRWEPENFEEPELVTWDNTGAPTFEASVYAKRRLRNAEKNTATLQSGANEPFSDATEIAPTQRLSQMKGMFD